MRADGPWKGKRVAFIGAQCSVAKIFCFERMFKDNIYTVIDTRSDCCNLYLILDGVDGAYNSKMFVRVPPTPP